MAKPNIVTKPDDNADMKDEGNIGGSDNRYEEQQMTTRRPKRKAAEKANLKKKHCH